MTPTALKQELRRAHRNYRLRGTEDPTYDPTPPPIAGGQGAVTLVQAFVGPEVGTSTSRGDSFASDVTAGNTLISCVQFYNQSSTTAIPDFAVGVHDNNTNNWTRITAGDITRPGHSYGQRISWWILRDAPAGATTVSFTPDTGTWTFQTLWEFTPAQVDTAYTPATPITNTGTATGLFTEDGGTYTPSVNGAVALMGLTMDNSASTWTPDAGWTSRFNGAAGDGQTWSGETGTQTTAGPIDFRITSASNNGQWALSGIILIPPGIHVTGSATLRFSTQLTARGFRSSIGRAAMSAAVTTTARGFRTRTARAAMNAVVTTTSKGFRSRTGRSEMSTAVTATFKGIVTHPLTSQFPVHTDLQITRGTGVAFNTDRSVDTVLQAKRALNTTLDISGSS